MTEPKEKHTLRSIATRARAQGASVEPYQYPVKPPTLMPGVAPEGVMPLVMALDANPYGFAAATFPGGGFPGFALLSQLATRAEYRAFASALSTELTREWIEFTSKQDDDDDTKQKIKDIEEAFTAMDVRGLIQRAAEHDCLFGRAQIFIDIAGADRKTPLILDPRTVPPGAFNRAATVEAVWTTPCAYNALDPAAPDFYKPTSWFMLGQEVHASRLLTVVTRPLPDILKPAFNFAGMSLSQLAEPYVDNWLRTRQSVADLINNFSITALATSMDQVLTGDADGADLFARADLFTATRSNKGLMLLDKDREELIQVNTPLSGLHELQAQSQEHMCSVSRTPAIVLTGISPSGLNASSDGEIRIFYDWIAAQQNSYWRSPIEIILKTVQLSLFGEIDPDIGFKFKPLYQMTPKELAEIREGDARTADTYVGMGAIDATEVRERLAADPLSGYQGLDVSVIPVAPANPADDVPPGGLKGDLPAQDEGFEESKHPRAENGQFGSGGGVAKLSKSDVYSSLADADDNGGKIAAEAAAKKMIEDQPELEAQVKQEMADLGYPMPGWKPPKGRFEKITTFSEEELKPDFHRFTGGSNADTGVGYMMFSNNIDRVSSAYGKNHHTVDLSELSSSEKINSSSASFKNSVDRALRKNPEFEQYSSSDFSPDDIVDTAAGWDDPKVVEYLTKSVFEPKGWKLIETPDGAIVLDKSKIKSWPSQ